MSYLAFLLIFILPPLLVLLAVVRGAPAQLGDRARWTLPVMALIALLYTTPWDNYLVYRGVWSYGSDRVLGIIGYVPIEEYAFFVLQPLLTGAWTYFLLLRSGARPHADHASADGSHHARRGRWRTVGMLGYAIAAIVGALAIGTTSGLYLGLILVWAAPVLAAQWYIAAPYAAALPRVFALAVTVPTLYLQVADRIAIGAGIWSISPRYTTGLHLAGLPIEEALFFLVTNLLVVQGVLLFLRPARAPAPRTVRIMSAA
jgi:lycopene cyclase domain-containing protein